MSLKLIKEAQTLSTIKSKKELEVVKELQSALGVSLKEAADLYKGQFDMSITPEDYEEWLQQTVLQAENLKREGVRVSLNKKASFADIVGEVLENDPAGKVVPGSEEFAAVVDVLWKKYQEAKSQVRVAKVRKHREEEEAASYSKMDRRAERQADPHGDLFDDEGNFIGDDISQHPDYEAMRREFDRRPRYDSREAYRRRDPKHPDWGMEDEESNVIVAPDPELPGTVKSSNYDAEDRYMADCPYDEGTPEADAWMAGFEAAMADQDDEYEDDDDFADGEDFGYDDEDDGREDYDDVPTDNDADEFEIKRTAEDEESSVRRMLGNSRHGQQDRQERVLRVGREEEERTTLRDILNAPKDTLNKAVKDMEIDGARAFNQLQFPKNPHAEKSMAYKAWERGFKNAAKETFGFFDKPFNAKAAKAKAKKK